MRSKNILLLFIFLFIALDNYANRFDMIRTASEDQRVMHATEIYKSQLRNADSASLFRELQYLSNIANELHDKKLQCAIFAFKADYFSHNRGFNSRTHKYYDQAIKYAKENKLAAEEGIYLHEKGYNYFIFKQYVPAYQCFLKSQDIFNRIGYDKIPNITLHTYQISSFYYHLGDLENTRKALLKALQYKITSRDSLNMINTLGLIKRSNSDYSGALNYFDQVLKVAERHHDSAWITIATGNIGSIYFLQGKYDRALPYLKFDYERSLKYVDNINAAAALLRIAKIQIVHKNFSGALTSLNITEQLLSDGNELNKWIEIYEMKSVVYEAMGQHQVALEYRKKYESAKDTLAKQTNIAAVERVKLKWEADKHAAEISTLQDTAKTEAFKRNSIIAILFLLTVIFLLLFTHQKIKRKNEKELFEKQEALLISETIRTEDELTNARNALVTYTENLRQKTELIESFKTEIENMEKKLSDQSIDQTRIEHLEKLMNTNLMTNENWDEFKLLFNKVYKDFFFQLKNRFSNLTETDIRISALIKLKLSNREMANMLGITPDAIKKARQRLRKKIDLPEEVTLDSVIAEIANS